LVAQLFADGARAIAGSINLSPGSFHSRRELAIEVRDKEVVERVHKLVHRENSRPMDNLGPGAAVGAQRGNSGDIQNHARPPQLGRRCLPPHGLNNTPVRGTFRFHVGGAVYLLHPAA